MSVASRRKKGAECGVRMRRLSKNHLFAVGSVQLAIPDGAPLTSADRWPLIVAEHPCPASASKFFGPACGDGFRAPARAFLQTRYALSLAPSTPANTLILRAMSAGWRFFSAVGFVATGPILFDPFGQ
jgi:hypothetical protein